jgi:hypothetical protein
MKGENFEHQKTSRKTAEKQRLCIKTYKKAGEKE